LFFPSKSVGKRWEYSGIAISCARNSGLKLKGGYKKVSGIQGTDGTNTDSDGSVWLKGKEKTEGKGEVKARGTRAQEDAGKIVETPVKYDVRVRAKRGGEGNVSNKLGKHNRVAVRKLYNKGKDINQGQSRHAWERMGLD